MVECFLDNEPIDFKDMVSHLADGIYFTDSKGIVIYANQGLVTLLGFERPSEILGKSIFSFIALEYREFIKKIYAHEISPELVPDRIEVKVLRRDGFCTWAEVRPTDRRTIGPNKSGSYGVVRDISEFKQLQENLQNLAITDDLTNLYNRRGFKLMAEQELKHSLRLQTPTILLSMDIDDFKYINDTFGHEEGDKVLKLVASTLRHCFRTTDIIARWGGDEFVVLALDAPVGYVSLLSDRFEQSIRKASLSELLPYPLSVTTGMESSDILESVSLNRLIVNADRNMYASKRKKRLGE
ncbi:MAG: sensor domain-containing diguanylate cyclase [Sphaerochaeta sp.]|nr:sensor domain-containing diguanylate cyclase [Sphaerochaeta sp.]